ncbi:cyanide hydratase/nitrilase-like protein [Mollisia scopiformis]|uniref:nitrilase n=1 Tax=Mollisia scopiformis TaxID=149040 RepID=A0A194X4Z5_MOLSC|nr:cyanide hydratase/nitrilase-like protein [Mollisia scopiformis]KUJ15250.1 cyanide hydratase/nitrilase-like protein [Mollisia scopiformis]
MTASKTVRVAVTQAEPAWLDLDGTIAKTIKFMAAAASNGAKIVTFPECWVPGYPAWIWSRPIDFEMTTLYTKNSLKVDSDQMRSLCAAAKKNKIAVCMGFSENFNNSLYISQAIIGADGTLHLTRRKLKPTHMERTIFGDSTGGNTLANVAEIEGVGNVSALACWEHIQPLLKYNTCLQRPDVHVAAWPPLWPHSGDGQDLYSMSRDGCRVLSRTFAIESQTYVLHTTAVLTEEGIQKMGTANNFMGAPGGGSSAIFGPDGRQLSKDLEPTEEGIIYGDLDFDAILRAKGFVDICGHYSRPDLLWLGTQEKENLPLRGSKSKTEEEVES